MRNFLGRSSSGRTVLRALFVAAAFLASTVGVASTSAQAATLRGSCTVSYSSPPDYVDFYSNSRRVGYYVGGHLIISCSDQAYITKGSMGTSMWRKRYGTTNTWDKVTYNNISTLKIGTTKVDAPVSLFYNAGTYGTWYLQYQYDFTWSTHRTDGSLATFQDRAAPFVSLTRTVNG